jgi:AAA+ superfamily predicted ATPase
MNKTARLKWLGHIAKKKDYIFGMQIIFTQPEVSIEKGRPT